MSSIVIHESKAPARSRRSRQRNLPSVDRRMQAMNRIFSTQSSNPLPRAQGYVPDNQVFKITQEVEVAGLTTSNVAPTFASYNFQIGNLDQVASLAAVFDQYRIDQIEFWLIPNTPNVTTGDTGLITSVIDYDDSNALTTIAQATDYTNAMTASGLNGHYRTWKPHAAVAYYSGTFVGFGNQASPWLDFASTNIQHYGLKFAATSTSAAQGYRGVYRLHVAMRNVR